MDEWPPLAEPSIAEDAFIADTARIFGDVTIASEASVWYGASIRAEVAPVTIGSGTNVQDNVVLHTDRGFPVVLGADVTIGHSAVIHGATVQDGALVGMGAIVLNGAVVQTGAFVAAGTVVPPGGVVPAGMLAVGNPMRVLREVRDSENQSTANGLNHYKHYAKIYAAMQESEAE
ncbi:MAG: gamma carbonic anhydrase family protein [Acidimicrobiia bacterium]|nr:gamma carbonic anhydrase family protein [Acidimicrobiia bacterium]